MVKSMVKYLIHEPFYTDGIYIEYLILFPSFAVCCHGSSFLLSRKAATGLVTNANMISKVCFPRLVVTAGSVITSFVHFVISAGFNGADDG